MHTGLLSYYDRLQGHLLRIKVEAVFCVCVYKCQKVLLCTCYTDLACEIN